VSGRVDNAGDSDNLGGVVAAVPAAESVGVRDGRYYNGDDYHDRHSGTSGTGSGAEEAQERGHPRAQLPGAGAAGRGGFRRRFAGAVIQGEGN
jgi:hypothetical protein